MKRSSILRRLREISASAAYHLGAADIAARAGGRWRLGGRPPFVARRERGSYLVLIYHRVSERPRRFAIDSVPLDDFSRQMAFLARNFSVLPLQETIERSASGRPLPPRALAITFDDGYEDNLRLAHPVLRRLRLPYTVFLAAGCIERGEVLWYDRVLRAFQGTRSERLKLSGLDVALDLSSEIERSLSAVRLLEALKGEPPERRDALIAETETRLDAPPDPHQGNDLLAWDQARELAKEGVGIGSHTLRHPILTRLPREELRREIEGSKRLIEERLGKPVHLFAYPNGRAGDFSPETIAALKEAGYRAALTTLAGWNTPETDPFQIRRVRPWSPRPARFALELARMTLGQ